MNRPTTPSAPTARLPLLALAAGGFAIGTGEFVVMGLLPNAAAGLHVSIPQAGHLISAYALGVVVGAPLLIAASVRIPRKRLLVILMTAYAAGNALSALAPDYWTLMAARFITGLPHGAYFGVAAVTAAGLVPVGRSARAMSVMFAGLTIANVVGVPLSTLLGQHVGWQTVFALVAVLAALAAVSVAILVPAQQANTQQITLKDELSAFANRRVLFALATAIIGGGALFCAYSYVAPMMTHVAGYAPSSIVWLLVLFGVGMTVGNVVGARLADRNPEASLYIALATESVLALLFIPALHNKITAAIVLFAFAAASFALVPALQNRLLHAAAHAPNVAAASNHAAFNIANALGAWLGGLLIAAGFGYSAPDAAAAVLGVAGLAVALCAGFVERRTARSEPVPIEREAVAAAAPAE